MSTIHDLGQLQPSVRQGSEYKVCVCGAGAVGKSAMTIQYINGSFITAYDPTIEDSYRKQTQVDALPALMDVLDTAGQEDYSALRSQYMRKGHGFLLIFSIADRHSFDEIPQFFEEICRSQDRDDPPCVLVGNKADLDDMRTVATVEGRDLAKSLACPYMECSAKLNLNVHNAFEDLVREIRKDRGIDQPDFKPKRGRLSKLAHAGPAGCMIL